MQPLQIVKSTSAEHIKSKMLPEKPRDIIEDICRNAKTTINNIFVLDEFNKLSKFGHTEQFIQYISQIKKEYLEVEAFVKILPCNRQDGVSVDVRDISKLWIERVSLISVPKQKLPICYSSIL